MNQITHAMTRASSVVLMSLALVATGCQQPDQSQKLKPIIDKNLAIWNTGNVKDLDSILDQGFIRHESRRPDVVGVEGMGKLISGLRSSYPDFKLVFDEVIYGDNKVVVRWTVTGTNTGPGEFPPTGKSVKVWGVSLNHFANGKLTEEWIAFDNHSVMEQLGFTLAPPAAAKP